MSSPAFPVTWSFPPLPLRDVGVVVAGDRVGEGRAPDVLDRREGVVAVTRGCARGQVDLDTDAACTGRGVVGRVGASAAVNGVVAAARVDGVVTIATVQLVGRRVTSDLVVAAVAVEDVADVVADEDVVAGAPVDVLDVDDERRVTADLLPAVTEEVKGRDIPCGVRATPSVDQPESP